MTTTASTEEASAAVADRDDAIGGGKASGGKQQLKTAGVRLVMAMGGSRGNKNFDDNVDAVQCCLPKTQQPAIGRGGEAATKTTQRNSTSAVGG